MMLIFSLVIVVTFSQSEYNFNKTNEVAISLILSDSPTINITITLFANTTSKAISKHILDYRRCITCL